MSSNDGSIPDLMDWSDSDDAGHTTTVINTLPTSTPSTFNENDAAPANERAQRYGDLFIYI